MDLPWHDSQKSGHSSHKPPAPKRITTFLPKMKEKATYEKKKKKLTTEEPFALSRSWGNIHQTVPYSGNLFANEALKLP